MQDGVLDEAALAGEDDAVGARPQQPGFAQAPEGLGAVGRPGPGEVEAVGQPQAEHPALAAPVVVGGIIPDADVRPLKDAGVAAVYTPKDFDLTRIMADIVGVVAEANGVSAAAAA